MSSTPLPDNISNPAKRALSNARIQTLEQLAGYTEKEIAVLHGIGPNALDKLKKALSDNGSSFKS